MRLKTRETNKKVPKNSVINTLAKVAPGPGYRIAIFYSIGRSRLTDNNTNSTPRKAPII